MEFLVPGIGLAQPQTCDHVGSDPVEEAALLLPLSVFQVNPSILRVQVHVLNTVHFHRPQSWSREPFKGRTLR